MKIGLFVQWGQRRGGPSAGPRRSFELCWLALLCCVRVCAWGRRPAPCLALPHRVTTHPVASSLHLSHRHRRRRTLAHHHITCRLVVGKWPGRRPSLGACRAELGPCVLEKYNKKWRYSFRKGEGRKPLGWTWPLGRGLPYPGRWNRRPGQLQRRAVIMHWDSLRDGLSPFVPSVLNLLNTATFVVATKNDNSEVSLFV